MDDDDDVLELLALDGLQDAANGLVVAGDDVLGATRVFRDIEVGHHVLGERQQAVAGTRDVLATQPGECRCLEGSELTQLNLAGVVLEHQVTVTLVDLMDGPIETRTV